MMSGHSLWRIHSSRWKAMRSYLPLKSRSLHVKMPMRQKGRSSIQMGFCVHRVRDCGTCTIAFHSCIWLKHHPTGVFCIDYHCLFFMSFIFRAYQHQVLDLSSAVHRSDWVSTPITVGESLLFVLFYYSILASLFLYMSVKGHLARSI